MPAPSRFRARAESFLNRCTLLGLRHLRLRTFAHANNKKSIKMNKVKTILSAAAVAVLAVSAPLAAVAQDAAAPAPTYATPARGETISGTIAAINGKYNISVRDQRGFIDNVSLHDGTIINPTGLRLAPGQSVTVAGMTSGQTFIANEIDTPYVMYGYPYAYYPGYGYPVYGVGFGFGGRFGYGGGGFGYRGRF
jgi:hypothetical protein